MFRVTSNGANRIDIELDGKLDSDGMRKAVDELLSKSEGIEHGRMMFRVGQYRLPTLAAIAIEFSHFFELMRMIGRFDRAAVIADQSWLRKASEFEGTVLPGLEIKAFGSDQEAEAEAWLEREDDFIS